MIIQTSRQAHILAVSSGRTIKRRRQATVDFTHLFGDAVFWQKAAKVVGGVAVFLLVTNLVLGSVISSLEYSIAVEQSRHQELEDKNITLLAEKARIWAPHNVEMLAAERLSLYRAKEEQVAWL